MTFILLFLTFFEVSADHDFHLSNTEIRYNIEESALQITSRIFIDDLESALAAVGHDNLFICTEKEAPEAEIFIAEYLDNNLIIRIDGVAQNYEFIGKEVSEDLQAVWCYMEIVDIECNEVIVVENNVLLEIFDDQKNIVRLNLDSGEKAMFILEHRNNSGTLRL